MKVKNVFDHLMSLTKVMVLV